MTVNEADIADFSDYKKAIETAESEEHLCKIVVGADTLYLRNELKMHDDEWPKITGLLSKRMDEFKTAN